MSAEGGRDAVPGFGERVKAAREAKGWTQTQLAVKAEVRQATISAIETGKSKGVDFDVLERLARSLGVEPGELLERDKKKGARALAKPS